jgi:hypothetical protein
MTFARPNINEGGDTPPVADKNELKSNLSLKMMSDPSSLSDFKEMQTKLPNTATPYLGKMELFGDVGERQFSTNRDHDQPQSSGEQGPSIPGARETTPRPF